MPAAFTTPEWVKDAVFYQIFPDRFARSGSVAKPSNLEPWDSPPTTHGFKGGDLLGIIEHLDYLQELGVNALYLNPVFQSTANHRYHTYDYYHVDPMLGGNDALGSLVNAVHQRGMHVILDGVFNHASRGFFQFNDILENGPASPYLDWFYITGWPLHAYETSRKPNYGAWWGLHALPKFNTETPAVREFLLSIARYWIEQGVDGWRLDVPGEIADDSFWVEFRRRVKQANPEAYMVGEIWQDGRHWLQGDQFDAVMNYLFTKASLSFFVGRELNSALLSGLGYAPVEPLDARGFGAAVDSLLALYPQQVTQVQMNLLDSHDTARFLSLARGDESALRLAVLFTMCYPGAPCVYYGDEVGMEGNRDPDCRRAFRWDQKQWNVSLLDHYRRCIALRQAHPALRRGGYRPLYAQDQIYAFGRHLGSDALVVVLNASSAPWEVSVPVADVVGEGTAVRAAWGQGTTRVVGGRISGLVVPARSGLVVEAVAE
jgi:cyclomaltodextrinase / maltogenic alpha-amylase / neopullulanase